MYRNVTGGAVSFLLSSQHAWYNYSAGFIISLFLYTKCLKELY